MGGLAPGGQQPFLNSTRSEQPAHEVATGRGHATDCAALDKALKSSPQRSQAAPKLTVAWERTCFMTCAGCSRGVPPCWRTTPTSAGSGLV